MATVTPTRGRLAAQLRPAARPQPRRAPLRVVRPDERTRALGRMSTLVIVGLFAILFAVAGLHAVLVQTQARLDAQRAANLVVVEEIDTLDARLAWIESPAGVEEWARDAGLVRPPGHVVLPIVPEGGLAAPVVADPFASSRSLTPIGMPASGPTTSPRLKRSSMDLAWLNASSKSTAQNAFNFSFSVSMLVIAARVSSVADTRRE